LCPPSPHLVLKCSVRLRGMACRYGRSFTLLEAKQVQGLIIRGSDEIWAVMSPNTPRPFPPRLDNRSVPVINSEVTSDRTPVYRHCYESGIESARTHNVPSYLVHLGVSDLRGPQRGGLCRVLIYTTDVRVSGSN
jgi:hypothetical protein